MDRDHRWERPSESLDNCGTIAGVVEILAVVFTATLIVDTLCDGMHRRVHLEPLLVRARRQLLESEPTVATGVQARRARRGGNVFGVRHQGFNITCALVSGPSYSAARNRLLVAARWARDAAES